jgi:SWI/SNF-related matrix-associated actin-dependent regulator 1 of chromatin subfamily A
MRYKSITLEIREKCPTCGKQAKELSRHSDEDNIYHHLECGHIIIYPKPKPSDIVFRSISGEELYPFQKENVAKFIESGGRLAILDQMGLGKTVSALAISKIYELTPTIIVCKSGLRYQWKSMIEEWIADLDEDLDIPIVNVQIIENSNQKPRNADYTIVSYDLLPRLDLEAFDNKYQLAIIDEFQQIKNTEAQRTRATSRLLKTIPYLVFTSGTPFKNNAAELYPMLHAIDPLRFPTKARFIYEFVETYQRGPYLKYGGIRNYNRFKQATSHFIIRHTQEEVLPELPEIRRSYIKIPLNGKKDLLEELEKEFQEFYYSSGKEDLGFFQNTLAYFSRMRHLTGLAKIDFVYEYVLDFIESTGRKIVVFTHHIDVREILRDKLKEHYLVLELTGEMPGAEKEEVKKKFNFDPEYKILLASTLASGEGHNLQHSCSDAIMMERQWNPANEEQAEFRFKRPGQKANSINIVYMIAEDSIDSYFTQVVETKRKHMRYSLDGVKEEWNQEELIRNLAEIIATKRFGKS